MRIITSIVAALLFVGCGSSLNIDKLTTEQKAARLVVVGVVGNSLDEDNLVVRDIKERGVSGVILFENNINPENSRENLTKFIDDMKSMSSTPLFVSIDQEGGLVNRLKSKYGFREMPSQQEVGASEGDAYAMQIAQTIAEEVASIGVNINFSPCVDVNVNPDCPVIGGVKRSFSADEQRVTQLASIYIDAHRKEGVLTSLKHFPGHGSSLVDSHLGLTDITDTWQERELTPYKELLASDRCDMVMISHLFNKNFDPIYPATMSKAVIDGMLRGELGWQGVVVSDDMHMKALTDNYGFEEAVTLGFNAGIDLFIFSRKTKDSDVAGEFIDIIVRGVESGKIEMKRLDEAVKRVEKLRKRL